MKDQTQEEEERTNDQAKEIEALRAKISRDKKETLYTLTGGIGGLGIIVLVSGATTSLPIAIGCGAFLLLVGVLWTTWISRH